MLVCSTLVNLGVLDNYLEREFMPFLEQLNVNLEDQIQKLQEVEEDEIIKAGAMAV